MMSVYKSFVASFICLALSGCTLAEPLDWGEFCPGEEIDAKLSYIQVDEMRYTPADPGDYADFFEWNRCPGSHPICSISDENLYYCSLLICKENQHPLNGGTCENDSPDHCGRHNNKCSENVPYWSEGRCEAGQCVVTRCIDDYILDGDGSCILSCTSDQHPEKVDGKTVCVDNSITNCAGLDCTKNAHWQTGSCDVGHCVFEECTEGYHPSLNKDKCEPHDIDNCGDIDVKCTTQNVVFSTNVECTTKGTCDAVECKTGFHLYNGACEEDTIENCLEHENRCPDVKNGIAKCERSAGHEGCQFYCALGFHADQNACVENTAESCGDNAENCNITVQYNSSTECVSKYCEENESCRTKGVCVATACNTGYVVENGKCVLEKTDTSNE